MSFTAVVLAGDRTPDDPVARAAGVPCKALALVGGRPMVQRVLDALGTAREVGARILCGPRREALEQDAGLRALVETGAIEWRPAAATPSLSTAAVLDRVPAAAPVLLTTADHALLTPAVVDYFCAAARASGADVVVGLARAEQVTAAFPGTRRTILRLKGGGYCGCNLFAFLTPTGRGAARHWRRVEQERKRPLRLVAGALGWSAILDYAVGRLTLEAALDRVSRRLGFRAGAVILPFPEAAVDVDSVADLQLVRAIVEPSG
ncbi:MAG TPA: nucleotidyltransferase family protein [Methylomirabilota bacterium]|nr:nucleotidyltransferase family protein [Methylomirabilota bacterium]